MYHDHLYDTHASAITDEIIALLTICQQLQSKKDGRKRPAPDKYSRDEYEFADRIRTACRHALHAAPVTTDNHALELHRC